MIRRRFLIALTTTMVAVGCGAREAADDAGGSESASTKSRKSQTTIPVVETKDPADETPSSVADTFDVELPRGPDWFIMQEGAYRGIEGSFMLAAVDGRRKFQLSVLVMPLSPKVRSFGDLKPGWERGFLKKATRKISSQDIRVGGRDAYRVIAALDAPDGTQYEVVGILMVAHGKTFTIGITKPGSNACDDPEARAFIESFKILDGQD